MADASVITPQQLNSFLSQLPTAEDAARSVAQSPALVTPAPVPAAQPPPQPYHATPPPQPYQATPPPQPYQPSPPPVVQMNNVSMNEKAPLPEPTPSPALPQRNAPPQGPPVLAIATAIYAYTPTDAGDLALNPGDRVSVREYMNGDWWGGLNERTNEQGIFPRSYVNVIDEKPSYAQPPPGPPPSYGNMPLEVSQGGQPSNSGDGSNKYKDGGKKIGKKFGNAAVFGAGATAGSNCE